MLSIITSHFNGEDKSNHRPPVLLISSLYPGQVRLPAGIDTDARARGISGGRAIHTIDGLLLPVPQHIFDDIHVFGCSKGALELLLGRRPQQALGALIRVENLERLIKVSCNPDLANRLGETYNQRHRSTGLSYRERKFEQLFRNMTRKECTCLFNNVRKVTGCLKKD